MKPTKTQHKYKTQVDRICDAMPSVLIGIMVILITVGLAILCLSFMDMNNEELYCDYDSCSQQSFYWNITGAKCFDSSNPNCSEFISIWNACQSMKNQNGVC